MSDKEYGNLIRESANSRNAVVERENNIYNKGIGVDEVRKTRYNLGKGNYIELDKFTPCLEDAKTGEIVKTNYSVSDRISPSEARKLKSSGWNFDWSKPQSNGYDIYKLYRNNSDRVEGMIALKLDNANSAVHVDIVESSPENRGTNKEYNGVGGHLFAIAAEKSDSNGYGGFVYFTAKTDLIAHYQKELGAKLVSGRVMAIDEQAAYNLLSKYELIEGDNK